VLQLLEQVCVSAQAVQHLEIQIAGKRLTFLATVRVQLCRTCGIPQVQAQASNSRVSGSWACSWH
jgi:hypothetical protein